MPTLKEIKWSKLLDTYGIEGLLERLDIDPLDLLDLIEDQFVLKNLEDLHNEL